MVCLRFRILHFFLNFEFDSVLPFTCYAVIKNINSASVLLINYFDFCIVNVFYIFTIKTRDTYLYQI